MKSRTVIPGTLNRMAWLALVLMAAVLMAAGGQSQTQTQPNGMPQSTPILRSLEGRQPNQPVTVEMPPINTPLTIKQKDAIVKSNFKTTQHDVDKLSKLVQMLDTEMKKSNPNVLSVSIVRQANKIEKLAKKIKDEAKAY